MTATEALCVICGHAQGDHPTNTHIFVDIQMPEPKEWTIKEVIPPHPIIKNNPKHVEKLMYENLQGAMIRRVDDYLLETFGNVETWKALEPYFLIEEGSDFEVEINEDVNNNLTFSASYAVRIRPKTEEELIEDQVKKEFGNTLPDPNNN